MDFLKSRGARRHSLPNSGKKSANFDPDCRKFSSAILPACAAPRHHPSHAAGVCAACRRRPGSLASDFVLRRRPGSAVLQGRRDGLGGEDRQPSADTHAAQRCQRAPRAASTTAVRPARQDGRAADRCYLAGPAGQPPLDLGPDAKGAQQRHFAGFVANNTINGRLVAMPWLANAGLWFHRADLLQKYVHTVPATRAELTVTAMLIQDGERAAANRNMWGYFWQGRAHAGLSHNALERAASRRSSARIRSWANSAAASAARWRGRAR
jgi:hypothetical protein